MLRTILAITGRPGLYKIISQGKGMLVVEELTNGKRSPAHAREKLVSLADISMYTENDDLPLGEILDRLFAKHDGKPVDLKQIIADGALESVFAEVVPDFDRDRVYKSDIKKLLQWYNILVNAGFDKFTEEETEEADSNAAEEPDEAPAK